MNKIADHFIAFFCKKAEAREGGVLAEKLGRGVQPASQNPYPIYDQNLRFSLPKTAEKPYPLGPHIPI